MARNTFHLVNLGTGRKTRFRGIDRRALAICNNCLGRFHRHSQP
jgi:hypothetical protein